MGNTVGILITFFIAVLRDQTKRNLGEEGFTVAYGFKGCSLFCPEQHVVGA